LISTRATVALLSPSAVHRPTGDDVFAKCIIQQELAELDRRRNAMVKSRGWATETPPACPKCGSQRVMPVMYGYPSVEGMEAARRGEVVLGGCVVYDLAPRWACAECHHQFPPARAVDPWETGDARRD
jgi:hypothetical protein